METLKIIRTIEGVKELIEYLKDKEYVAFDTETTGIKVDSDIIGYSVCAEPDVGYYVVTAEWDMDKQALIQCISREESSNFMHHLVGKRLVMHNAVFDCAMVERNYGVSLIESLYCDTMVLAHILDENRRIGLKELASNRYGAEAKKEQEEMKASVSARGGQLTKACYELYKADPELIGKYGAKDTILTYNLFYSMIPELYEEELDKFFFVDESMPLLKTATYDLNTAGLKVDLQALKTLKNQLQVETMQLKADIYHEITPIVKSEYPGTSAKNTFNINSGSQLSWLLFVKLGNTFPKVSNAGRDLLKYLRIRTPVTKQDKQSFIETVSEMKGFEWRKAGTVWDPKTRKYKGKAKVGEYWTYLSTDKSVMKSFAKKYVWVEKLLEYKKLSKILDTYVLGIEEKVHYGVIYPSFKQCGTPSGRYSSSDPNFQNLPKKDKRVKSCIVSRPGKVFVGADEDQLEARVFASMSGDSALINCFASGDDFYSVIGAATFNKDGCLLVKDPDDTKTFIHKYPELRDVAKVVGLSATYGTTAYKMAPMLNRTVEETQLVIDAYFSKFPDVKEFMLRQHDFVKEHGVVFNLYGRPRRLPRAKNIPKNVSHGELPYEDRTLLNLAVNFPVQSTGASIMNRAAIMVKEIIKEMAKSNPLWNEVKIVLQVHDELILEGPEELGGEMAEILQYAMENAVELPGVKLSAKPKIGKNLAELK